MIISKELKLSYSDLTKWVWKNKFYPKRYYSNTGSFVDFDINGQIDVTIDVRGSDIFRVTEDVTLNDSYKFPTMLVKDNHGNYREHSNTSVSSLLFIQSIYYIWYVYSDGSHELVWKFGAWL